MCLCVASNDAISGKVNAVAGVNGAGRATAPVAVRVPQAPLPSHKSPMS